MMQKHSAALTLLAALAFALSPLVVTGFNGFSPSQFPVPQINPPVQPAGYAFSIWGLIYLWLIAGAAFGLWQRRTAPDWAAMRPWLIASLVLGAGWIPLAQVSVLGATLLIWAMLATALMALHKSGKTDPFWQQAPVALYAGWLTAASSVSIGLLLAGYGLTGPVMAGIIGVLIALGIALTTQLIRPTLAYPAAVIWALVGVMVANASPPLWPMLALCGLGITLLGAGSIGLPLSPRKNL